MTLAQYGTILLKHWKLIITCCLAVGVGAYIGSKLMAPTYQSTAIVQVAIHSQNNQADYNSLLASDQLVQTEAKLAVSNTVLSEVVSHHPGLTVSRLAKEVTVTPDLQTQLFEITVEDPSPTGAADLANDVAATLIKQQAQAAQQDYTRSQQQFQQDLDSTRKKINTITQQIANLQAPKGKGAQIASSQAQIAGLQAQLTGLQNHYNQWQSLLAQLELSQAQNGDFLRTSQSAQPATSPVHPNVLLNTAAGLVVGLLLGLLLAVLFEQLDTRVRTAEALTQLVKWPVLATISRVDAKKEKIVDPPARSANIEAYRMLRTNIGFSALDKSVQAIMVTSAVPGEGKSTIAANLAIFMARAGKNTVLIDADLRRPTLHEKFQFPAGTMGLTNAIVACSQLQVLAPTPSLRQQSTSKLHVPSISLDPYMHTVSTANLLVMPSGPLPPNPPELLDSKAMDRLFVALAGCGAEVVIFDTPPLLALSDASILAPKVDATLVVIDITRANKKNLKRVKELLTQAGTAVLGCVVNKQRHSRKDTTYSYYYSYGTEEEHHNKKNGKVPTVPVAPTNGALPILPGQQSMPSNNGSFRTQNGNVPTNGVRPILSDQQSMPSNNGSFRTQDGNVPTNGVRPILPDQQSMPSNNGSYTRTQERLIWP